MDNKLSHDLPDPHEKDQGRRIHASTKGRRHWRGEYGGFNRRIVSDPIYDTFWETKRLKWCEGL